MACEPKMNSQARLRPYAPSTFFKDGALAQHPVEGTISSEGLEMGPAQPHEFAPQLDDPYLRKKDYAEQLPVPLSLKLLRRGQSQYKIYCSPCHGESGDARGMIVRHGFPPPPSFHTAEIRKKSVGYYYDVITLGTGKMYSYADRLIPADRWAVIAYIRALQLSGNFKYADLTTAEKEKVDH
jgi:hypothetical protein